MMKKAIHVVILLSVLFLATAHADTGIIYTPAFDAAMKFQSHMDTASSVIFQETEASERRNLAIDSENGYLYWMDRFSGVVERSDLNGQNIEEVGEIPPAVRQMVVNPSSREIVFLLDTGIGKYSLQDEQMQMIVEQPSIRQIAVASGRVYYLIPDIAELVIRRVALDGSANELVLSPSDIAHDDFLQFGISGDTLHFVARDFATAPEFWTAELDGTNPQGLFENYRLHSATTIQVDLAKERIYVFDEVRTALFDFQGNLLSPSLFESRLLFSWVNDFLFDAVSQNFFWFERESKQMYRLDAGLTEVVALTDRRPREYVNLRLDAVAQEVFYTDRLLGKVESVSLKTGLVTSHLEFLYSDPSAPFKDGFGSIEYSREVGTLFFVPPHGASSSQQSLYEKSLSTGLIDSRSLPMSIDPSERGLIEYSAADNRLYFTDRSHDELWFTQLGSASLSFTLITELEDGRIRSLQLDDENGMLYWLLEPDFSEESPRVYRYEIATGVIAEVFQGFDFSSRKPLYIAGGKLYWIIQADFANSEVWRVNLDGTEPELWLNVAERIDEFVILTDEDNDGLSDEDDECPLDASKIEPGACGCGTADIDSDGDGFLDCQEQCPLDASKTEPGACGCGAADLDSNENGAIDCSVAAEMKQVGSDISFMLGKVRPLGAGISKNKRKKQKMLRKEIRSLTQYFVTMLNTQSDTLVLADAVSIPDLTQRVSRFVKKATGKLSPKRVRIRASKEVESIIESIKSP